MSATIATLEPARPDESVSVGADAWHSTSVRDRLKIVRQLRHAIADDPLGWAREITPTQQRTLAESVGAEVWALADACRFLEKYAESLLAPNVPPGGHWRDWLTGVRVRIHHPPRGTVLVVGAGNYPLLLSAVPALQALVAGNRVLLKPPPGGEACCQKFVETLREAGLPAMACELLNSTAEAAKSAIESGVDHVVFTGSSKVGRQIWRQATELGATCTLELSGCDAVVVLAGADPTRVANCLAFGLDFNASATCIAPRRVFASQAMVAKIEERLVILLRQCESKTCYGGAAPRAINAVQQATSDGARLVWPAKLDESEGSSATMPPVVLATNDPTLAILGDDLFAPVLTLVSVEGDERAIEAANDSSWGLGAAVFGPRHRAEQVALRIEAGCVTVNDLIAPTADARVPFGGLKQSGYGITRGREGLLELTRSQAIVTRTGIWLPHLDRPRSGLAKLVAGLLLFLHGRTVSKRCRGLGEIVKAAREHDSDPKDTA